MKKILIIGGSAAGHTAAVRLREQDKDLEIAVISDEEYAFYDRARLAEFLSGALTEKDILLADDNFYANHNIALFKAKKACAVNTDKQTVQFKDRVSQPYDFLVIASGRSPQFPDIPGAKKTGVFKLYSLQDAKELQNWMIHDTVCLVGAHVRALKIAKALVHRYKVAVKIISKDDFTATDLPEGIEILQSTLLEIIGEGGTQAVKVKEGKVIAVSAVIFLDELKGNIDFLKDTGLKTQNGFIIVDANMRTNIANIFSCGAVCQRQDNPSGIKTWEEAINEGINLADNLIRTVKEQTCQTY